jgi:hypothetical protein
MGVLAYPTVPTGVSFWLSIASEWCFYPKVYFFKNLIGGMISLLLTLESD